MMPTHKERYQCGELRLDRINRIHWIWLCDPSPSVREQPQKGFFNDYYDCGSFFQRNTIWFATSTIFTAMQVGLGAEHFEDNIPSKEHPMASLSSGLSRCHFGRRHLGFQIPRQSARMPRRFKIITDEDSSCLYQTFG